MKILFLVPYPLKQAPSQRFRFEQYFETLQRNDVAYYVQSFLAENTWRIFYKSGKPAIKALAILNGFWKRFRILFKLSDYKFIFIHREATPIGPPIFEWLIAKVFRKKIIYDFDDAIWLTDRKDESVFLRLLKWRTKVAQICRWSHKVSCGNEYLCLFARQFNSHVVYNPTTIDTELLHNETLHTLVDGFNAKKEAITIGWTGSHSTLKYLAEIETVLQCLERKFPTLRFLLIADRKPDLQLQNMDFVAWNKETEVSDLIKIDIGIMPLPNDEWANGKCGFKALQYMSLKIPTVADPVGVNKTIIQQGVNGFLPTNLAEWEQYLTLLIKDEQLRKNIGEAGRATVVNRYSVLSNSETFTALLQ